MARITKVESIPNTRKYESGTAFDPSRIFRDPSDLSVLELGDLPTPFDIKDMLRLDPQARQLASALKLPLRGAKWDIEASEGDNGEKEFIEFALNAPARQGGMTTPMRVVISQMANAILYRFQPFEKVWKISDSDKYRNKVVLHKLGWRPTSTCKLRIDDNGSFNGFVQNVYKNGSYRKQVFDPKRSLVFIHGTDEEPLVGMTPFDTVYAQHVLKKKVSFFYYAFLENVAFPRTLAKVLSDDEDELTALLDKARKLAYNGIIGLMESESLESYESNRTTRDYQVALEYLDLQMAKACLSQFLDLGTSGERGSYALSQDKSKFFFNALEAVLMDIADTINNYLIADLVQYNFGKNASYPKLVFRPLNDETADAVVKLFSDITMANAPNVTAPFILQLMNKVEEILGLEIDPLAEYDEETLQEIHNTIPSARERIEMKAASAGSGQNPITGKDRNNNNQIPQGEEPGNLDTVGSKTPDNIDVTRTDLTHRAEDKVHIPRRKKRK